MAFGFGTQEKPASSDAKSAFALIVPQLDQITGTFLKQIFGDQDDNLQKAQARHWTSLLGAEKSDDFARLLPASPLVKPAAGVPAAKIADAYAKAMRSMAHAIADSRRNSKDIQALTDAAATVIFADMGVVLAGGGSSQGGGNRARAEIQAMSEIVERETDNIIEEVGFQAGRMNDVSQSMETDSIELSALVERITETTNISSSNVATVASATEELEASSREIAARVHKTTEIAGNAVTRAHETSQTMNSLSETALEIGKVVDIVKRISDQTKLLALNATIEAARAGEAGKGFSVVANEVKNLASQTEKAIQDVNSQILAIQNATSNAVEAIEGIGGAIEEVSQLSADISASVEQQTAAIAEISTSAQEVSQHTKEIAADIQAARVKSQNALDTAESLKEFAANIRRDIDEMEKRFRVVLRTTDSRDGDSHERVPIAADIELDFGKGDIRKGVTADMSVVGLLARIKATEKDAGKAVSILLDGNTRLHGVLKVVSGLGSHIQFDELTPEVTNVIKGLLAKTREHDSKIAELGKPLADRMGKLLEEAVRNGTLAMNDLMGPVYTPIEGTDPQQFLTPFVAFTDQNFTPLQEAILEKDSKIVFAAGVDRNGFLPTHNKKYSQPQRPGETAWNTGNCRNRRVFDDRAGLMAARNIKPVLLQTYFRDMGSEVVFMKECDVPIMVQGKHWGNLRVGYRG
ncbi:methyl-accepting chemotaxis protein [Thalassospira sp.]|uniref:methyl-accepting chemotaxis protein n=1 Tax=Thalassospira sp. TaxID=1912094 RepID=UPI002734F7F9|nr:methyl-accepting chemotaxis protein [Thalassospira sp.]MDP2698797.1 methyl-accepting chemotaxis protein [Thalassospira sp.]